jgi:hypothetical protein
MKITIVAGLALISAGCAPTTAGSQAAQPRTAIDLTRQAGQPPLEETYPDTAGMPEDVQRYIVQWSDCMHWAGEPDFNAARRRQIREAIKETCTGVDAIGRQVRARHAGNAAVLERLKTYENVED